MLRFNSKLDNSISATQSNINVAIEAIEMYNSLRTSLSINASQAIQALIDSGQPTCENASSVQKTVDRWPEGKSTGKTTWCSKRGLLTDSFELTDLAKAIKNNNISYQEYCLIILSKIWVSDENTPANLVNTLKILSCTDTSSCSFQEAFVKAYNGITNSAYTSNDFHSAEMTQFSGIVSNSGVNAFSPHILLKGWGANFDTINVPNYGNGSFPDFNNPDDVYKYMGELKSGIFEVPMKYPEDFNKNYPHISVQKLTSLPLQQIYYGAPGTGKSYAVEEVCKKYTHFRTTFHPDSDYSTFVGCFKPITKSIPFDGNLPLKTKDELTQLWNNYTLPNHCFFGRYYRSLKELSSADWVEIFITNAISSRKTTLSLVTTEIPKCIKAAGEYDASLLKDDKVVYSFVPQAFINAYITSWKDLSKPVFLIIEEINRGNCAQIFGDLFQLLDRKDNGFSSYEIDANEDIKQYLKLSFANVVDIKAPAKIKNGDKLSLPPNLHIWATMNTSDQSLFPIDSAFKRRWDWKYVPITDAKKEWKLDMEITEGEKVDWYEFLEKINKIIYKMTMSADKQMGYFFCKADEKSKLISVKTFVNKVIFYLWNDVFKDYAMNEGSLFKYKKDDKDEDIMFTSFFNDEGEPNAEVAKAFVENVMKYSGDETAK